jgi:chromosome partitioning protein
MRERGRLPTEWVSSQGLGPYVSRETKEGIRPVKLDPESGDGKDGSSEPEPSGILTVRVRIRGRDQRSEQGERPSERADDDARQVVPEAAAVEIANPVAADEDLPDTTTIEEPMADRAADQVTADAESPESESPESESSGPLPSDAQPDSPGFPAEHPLGVVPDETVVERGAYVPRPTPRILAVANQKGGVGKTTTAVNLGAALAELGYRVLVVDLDPQGNATTGLGIDARSFELSMYDVLMRDVSLDDAVEPTSMKNLFVAPATIDLAGAEIELVPSFSRELKLRRALEAVSGDFEFILIDCPPSLGLITVNGLAAADEVLVPIQCEYYALEGLGQLLRNVHLVQANLNDKLEVSTIVLTMYDARTKLAEQVADEVRTHFGNKVCRNVIPRTVRISEAPSFGQPITVFDPTSRGAIAYRELAKEVSGGEA